MRRSRPRSSSSRRGRRVDRGQAGRLDPDGRRRLDRRDALRPGRRPRPRAAGRRSSSCTGSPANRQQMNALVEGYGFTGRDYAILTFDARGHGESGGLVGIDGPREIADTRAIRDWLAARPDVSDTRIGAWGISYGGGAVFNSLVAGVPWAAVVDGRDVDRSLLRAHAAGAREVRRSSPGSPARSRPTRRDPSLDAVQAAAFAGNAARSASRGPPHARASRSSAPSRRPSSWRRGGATSCSASTRPRAPSRRLEGPKLLYVGLHGHAPSTFPAADTGCLMDDGARLVRLLPARRRLRRASGVASRSRPEKFGRAGRQPRTRPPARRRPTSVAFPGVTTFARSGKAVRTSAPLRSAIEIFGTPTVQMSIARERRLVEARRRAHRPHAERARRSSSAPAACRRSPARRR